MNNIDERKFSLGGRPGDRILAKVIKETEVKKESPSEKQFKLLITKNHTIMSDTNKKKTKKHADFQDDYHKSSNFPTLEEQEGKKLEIEGDGEVKLKDADKKDSGKKKS